RELILRVVGVVLHLQRERPGRAAAGGRRRRARRGQRRGRGGRARRRRRGRRHRGRGRTAGLVLVDARLRPLVAGVLRASVAVGAIARGAPARAALACVVHGTEEAVVARRVVRLRRVRARRSRTHVVGALVSVVGARAGACDEHAAGRRVAAVGRALVAVVADDRGAALTVAERVARLARRAGVPVAAGVADERRVLAADTRHARVAGAGVRVVAVRRRSARAAAARALLAGRARIVVGARGAFGGRRMRADAERADVARARE